MMKYNIENVYKKLYGYVFCGGCNECNVTQQ